MESKHLYPGQELSPVEWTTNYGDIDKLAVAFDKAARPGIVPHRLKAFRLASAWRLAMKGLRVSLAQSSMYRCLHLGDKDLFLGAHTAFADNKMARPTFIDLCRGSLEPHNPTNSIHYSRHRLSTSASKKASDIFVHHGTKFGHTKEVDEMDEIDEALEGEVMGTHFVFSKLR